jgi:hypothetical protein
MEKKYSENSTAYGEDAVIRSGMPDRSAIAESDFPDPCPRTAHPKVAFLLIVY